MKFSNSPQGDELVRSHLKFISAKLECLTPYALILGGSFGRGEGIIVETQPGSLQVLNDYDIAVVISKGSSYWERRCLRKLSDLISNELAIPHIDLIPLSIQELLRPQVSMLRYDLKFGSHVFLGNPTVLDLIPYDRQTKIPEGEVENLLVNRLVTYVEGHPDSGGSLNLQERARKICKVIYALIDTALIQNSRYTTSYQSKLQEFEALSSTHPGFRELTLHLDWCRRAWCHEVTPNDLQPQRIIETWESIRLPYLASLLRAAGNAPSITARLCSWRGKSNFQRWTRDFISKLRGRAGKYAVECKLAALIDAYPQHRFYPEIQVNVPAAKDSNQHSTSEWQAFAYRLIQLWHKS